MIEETEVLDPQTEDQEEEAPEATEPTLTAEQIAELKKRADVSSQNYERAKKAEEEKKRLQNELNRINEQGGLQGYEPDLTEKVSKLESELALLRESQVIDTLTSQYPILKDKMSEFDFYRQENLGMSLQTAVKGFLIENDLLTETPKRKGLEKGGSKRTPPASGKLSAEDVKRLREDNYKEYMKLVRQGKIDMQ